MAVNVSRRDGDGMWCMWTDGGQAIVLDAHELLDAIKQILDLLRQETKAG